MKLPPFLLDQWLQQKFSANPPIEFDLGSSTGPTWTFRELLTLGGDIEELLATNLFYTPPDGSAALREELARMHGVEPERVLVMTGASEAPGHVSSRRRTWSQRGASQSRGPRQ